MIAPWRFACGLSMCFGGSKGPLNSIRENIVHVSCNIFASCFYYAECMLYYLTV